MNTILEALWFFLPAVIANQCPGFTDKLLIPGNRPVSEKWLGANKTWSAYYVATVGAILTIYLQRLCPEFNHKVDLIDYTRPDLWLVGGLLGFGTILGDHLKSFAKRLIGIPPGGPWWPFDQLDHVVGSLVMVIPAVGWIGWPRATVITVTVLSLHRGVNWLGYKVGIRKVPW